jgi:hypothetical protein
VTTQQKAVPFVALFVMALGLIWSLLPFKFADVVNCEAPFFGAKNKNEAPPTSFIDAKEDCHAKGKSRLSVTAVTVFVAALASAAIVSMKPISSACAKGDHDDCREYWLAGVLGEGSGLSCQCECHAGVW